jgi:hypothetical protein
MSDLLQLVVDDITQHQWHREVLLAALPLR